MKNKKIKIQNIRSGFSLVEVLVAIFIVSLIMMAVGAFQADVFKLNSVIQSGLSSQNDARKIIRPMVDEVRSASESSVGSYPIATATETVFTFYSDIDNDSLKERVRYFLDGSDFKKGVLKPTGSPFVYDESNENITEVVHNVINSEIFSYFDSSYDGTSSYPPLDHPVSSSVIRLVKIELVVDEDPNTCTVLIIIIVMR